MTKKDSAYLQVYEGIKVVMNQLRDVEIGILREMEKTDFVSLQHVELQDTFVFPHCHILFPKKRTSISKKNVKDQADLLTNKTTEIHGEEMS